MNTLEHVGGGLDIFAQAITGKTGAAATTEFMDGMKKGLYDSAKWLPIVAERMAKVAQESGTLDVMSNNLDSTLARLNNKWADFIKKMDEAGVSDAMGRFITMLTGKLESLEEIIVDNKESIVGLIDGFTKMFDLFTSKEFILTAIAAGLTAIYFSAKNAAGGIAWLIGALSLPTLRGAAVALWSMAGAFLTMAAPVLLTFGAFALLVLAVEDFHAWMNDKDSVFGYWLGESDEFFKTVEDGFKNIREWWDVSMTYLKNGWDGFTAWVGKPFKIAGQWIDDKLESAQNFISQPAVQGGVNLLQPKMAASGGVNYNIGSVSVTANNYEEFSRNVPQKVKR